MLAVWSVPALMKRRMRWTVRPSGGLKARLTASTKLAIQLAIGSIALGLAPFNSELIQVLRSGVVVELGQRGGLASMQNGV